MKKENKINIKYELQKQLIFFCIYWGIFAIAWHFASYIELEGTKTSVLYESCILTPIFSIMLYIVGVYCTLIDFTTKKDSTSSLSKDPSNKRP